MIVRPFQTVTQPGAKRDFAKFFYEPVIPLVKITRGIVHVLPGALRSENPCAFSFVKVRENLDALQAFVGEDYQAAHVDPP